MRRISPLTNALGYAVVAGLTLPLVVLLGVSLNAGVEQNFPPSGLSLRWRKAPTSARIRSGSSRGTARRIYA